MNNTIKIVLFYLGFLLLPYSLETSFGTFRSLMLVSALYFVLFPIELYKINKKILVLSLLLIFLTIASGLRSDYFSLKSIGQIFFIILGLLYTYRIYVSLGLKTIYKHYLYIVSFTAFGMYIQSIAYVLKIKFLYDFSYIIPQYVISPASFGLMRAHFYLAEPAGITYVFALAASMSIFSLIYKKKLNDYYISRKQSIFIIGAYLLTFSSLGIIVIILTLVAVVLMNMKNIKYLIVLLLLAIPFIYFISINEAFLARLTGFGNLLDNNIMYVSDMNISVWAIYSNALVAIHNAKEYFPFGVGIGNHQLSYYVINSLVYIKGMNDMQLNTHDAASLFLRILSEFGFIGVLLLFVYLVKYFNYSKKNFSLYILNKAFLIAILIILLRHGNYLFVETIFYFIGYTISSKPYTKLQGK